MHVFALLADPVRRRIVATLAKGEHDVSRLVEQVGPEFLLSRPAISQHLRLLREAEFVEFRQVGATRRYRLAWNAMDRLDAEVEALFLIWENRVGSPYPVDLPVPPARLHRAGRGALRGRTQANVESRSIEDDWWSFLPS